jgi:NAD(P)-dependent dehydrogenase (short-subunit alcohol dehydrogenase family)
MNPTHHLIVGGSGGIGAAIARRLAQGGHRVLVLARTPADSPPASGVTFHQGDVLDDNLHLDFLPETLQGLVYCPGTIRLRPFGRLTEAEFLEDWRINVLGAVRVLQACQSALKKSPRGASVVLFSTVAVRTGLPFHASIASAKGAVEGLARALAAEWAPRIRVNAIAPSLTDTPLAAALLGDERRRQAAAERHPMQRIGDPEEVARLAVFLLEDPDSWTTGQVFHVDGGLSALRPGR